MAKVKKVSNKSGKNNEEFVKSIIKRDGRVVPFDIEKIANAIFKGMTSIGEGSQEESALVANKVYGELVRIAKKFKNFIPTVEGVQDIVEAELMRADYIKTAKHYVLYRDERSQIRAKGLDVPENVKKLATDSKNYFRNSLGEFVYYRTYSKWIDEESRRETWIETVGRYITFMKENLGNKLNNKEYEEILRREGHVHGRAC